MLSAFFIIMLSSNQLRIGNYIFLGEEKELKKVNSHVISFMDLSEKRGDVIPFCPILITKEWLLKFGFVEQSPLGQRTFFAYGNLTVELCAENQNAFYFNGTLLCFHKYIHNLQNIVYSLFDVELNCA